MPQPGCATLARAAIPRGLTLDRWRPVNRPPSLRAMGDQRRILRLRRDVLGVVLLALMLSTPASAEIAAGDIGGACLAGNVCHDGACGAGGLCAPCGMPGQLACPNRDPNKPPECHLSGWGYVPVATASGHDLHQPRRQRLRPRRRTGLRPRRPQRLLLRRAGGNPRRRDLRCLRRCRRSMLHGNRPGLRHRHMPERHLPPRPGRSSTRSGGGSEAQRRARPRACQMRFRRRRQGGDGGRSGGLRQRRQDAAALPGSAQRRARRRARPMAAAATRTQPPTG